MRPGKDEIHDIGAVVDYLRELPQDMKVRTLLVQDDTFTVLVDSSGEARTVRNGNDARWFFIELPVRT